MEKKKTDDRRLPYLQRWRLALECRVEDILRKFKATPIDEQNDRINYILNELTIQSTIIFHPDVASKSPELSVKHRVNGNKYFELNTKEALNSAFEEYTKSISYAKSESLDLSLAYANRSAVFFKAKLLEDCLKDIDSALANSYPDNLKAKLFLRKANCLQSLNPSDSFAIKNALTETRQWVDKMEGENLKFIKKMMEKPSRPSTVCYKSSIEDIPPKLNRENPKIPGLSDAVELKYSEKFGRHMVATREIMPGEVLGVQKPYAKTVLLQLRYRVCWECGQQTWSSLPCENCSEIVFCSIKCRDKGQLDHHDIECHVLRQLLLFGISDDGLMGLRLTVKALKESKNSLHILKNELLKVSLTTDPLEKGFTNGILHPEKFASVNGLTSNQQRNLAAQSSVLVDSILTAYFLARNMNFIEESWGDLNPLKDDSNFLFLVELIEKNNLTKLANSITIDAPLEFSKEIKISNAVTPALSFFNHSCIPMISRNIHDGYLVYTSVCPIKKGQQIFDQYGLTNFAMETIGVRRKRLMLVFNVVCNCEACINDWPMPLKKSQLLSRHYASSAVKTVQTIDAFTDKYDLLAKIGGDVYHATDQLSYLSKDKYTICKLIENSYKHFGVNSYEATISTSFLMTNLLFSQKRFLIL